MMVINQQNAPILNSPFRLILYWKQTPASGSSCIGQLLNLTAHLTPGYTKGCATWTTVVEEDGKKYNVVFLCGVRVNEGIPLVGNPKYAKAFQTLKSLPCDVFLGAHGYWFEIKEKVKRLQQGAKTNPYH